MPDNGKTPPNDLPTIIDECGDYRTRDGRRVTIHAIKPATPGTTSFNAKGSIWKNPERIGLNPPYEIWHVSGRCLPLELSGRDIVGHWSK